MNNETEYISIDNLIKHLGKLTTKQLKTLRTYCTQLIKMRTEGEEQIKSEDLYKYVQPDPILNNSLTTKTLKKDELQK